jgi:hypothetical protein
LRSRTPHDLLVWDKDIINSPLSPFPPLAKIQDSNAPRPPYNPNWLPGPPPYPRPVENPLERHEMKCLNSLLLVLASIFFLGACVTPPVYDTADKVTAATTIERDDYKKSTWIQSPLVQYSNSYDRCRLRVYIGDAGAQFDQLYVVYTPSDWAFLERAHDNAGQSLEVTVIDRDVSSSRYGVSLSEHVAVSLTRSYMVDAAHNGLDIKISGKSGSTVVKLPPHFIQGFLDKVNQHLGQP